MRVGLSTPASNFTRFNPEWKNTSTELPEGVSTKYLQPAAGATDTIRMLPALRPGPTVTAPAGPAVKVVGPDGGVVRVAVVVQLVVEAAEAGEAMLLRARPAGTTAAAATDKLARVRRI
jgi:hypothetical protein